MAVSRTGKLNERMGTVAAWLLPMLELVGAEVLTTDDADGFKEMADRAEARPQICQRHVTTNVLTFICDTIPHGEPNGKAWFGRPFDSALRPFGRAQDWLRSG